MFDDVGNDGCPSIVTSSCPVQMKEMIMFLLTIMKEDDDILKFIPRTYERRSRL
jgi:hypothetical protein